MRHYGAMVSRGLRFLDSARATHWFDVGRRSKAVEDHASGRGANTAGVTQPRRNGAHWWALAAFVTVGCSSEAQSPAMQAGANTPGTPPSTNSTELAVDDANQSASSGSGNGNPAPTASSENPTSAPSAPASPSSTASGVIEPGNPIVLARDLVFGARLCLGSNNQLYYPNRVGYPLTPGLEELWAVSRTGGDAHRIAAPGSVTGCAWLGEVLWVGRNDGNTIAGIEATTGALLEPYVVSGTPLQVASNSTRLFASLNVATTSDVVSIDPTSATPPQLLWTKGEGAYAYWLRADDDRVAFSAKSSSAPDAWIVHVSLSPYAVTEVTTAGDLGAVDFKGDFLYYAHYTNGQVRQVDLTTGIDTVLAEISQPWGLVVDGDYLYVGTRPDYCTGTEGRLYRVPRFGGGSVALLADNLNCPSQLVTDDAGLYWINTGSWAGPRVTPPESAPADGSVMHLPRQG